MRKTFFVLIALLFFTVSCSLKSGNNKLLKSGEVLSTPRMSYVVTPDDSELIIDVKNNAFELKIISELYVEFFDNKSFLAGFNRRTFRLSPDESEKITLPLMDNSTKVKVFYREYSPGRFRTDYSDYYNFGRYTVFLDKDR